MILNYVAVWTILGLAVTIPFTSISVARLYHNLLCDYEKNFSANACDIYLVEHNLWEYVAISIIFIVLFVQGARVFYTRLINLNNASLLQKVKTLTSQKSVQAQNDLGGKVADLLQAIELYRDVFGSGKLPKTRDDLLKVLSEADLQGVDYSLIGENKFKLCINGICKLYELAR